MHFACVGCSLVWCCNEKIASHEASLIQRSDDLNFLHLTVQSQQRLNVMSTRHIKVGMVFQLEGNKHTNGDTACYRRCKGAFPSYAAYVCQDTVSSKTNRIVTVACPEQDRVAVENLLGHFHPCWQCHFVSPLFDIHQRKHHNTRGLTYTHPHLCMNTHAHSWMSKAPSSTGGKQSEKYWLSRVGENGNFGHQREVLKMCAFSSKEEAARGITSTLMKFKDSLTLCLTFHCVRSCQGLLLCSNLGSSCYLQSSVVQMI